VHIDSSLRSKFDDKAREGLLVGVMSQAQGYLVFLSDTRNVVTSFHVSFNKHADKPEQASSDAQTPTSVELSDASIKPIDESEQAPLGELSMKEALSSPFCAQWEAAIQSELDSLESNGTWELAKLNSVPPNAKVFSSKMILRIKYAPDGNISKYKARLVLRGNEQREGLDYEEVYAPTVHKTTIRVLLALAAQHDLIIHQMDVCTAFLNPALKEGEEIFMRLPLQLRSSKDDVCRLKKALYGLKQAPRRWNECLQEFLLSEGFTRGKADSCLYVKGKDVPSMLLVAIYVDDLLILGRQLELLTAFKTAICKRFKMVDGGPATYYTGFEIQQDITNGVVSISQAKYVRDILEKAKMIDATPASTPLPAATQLSKASHDDALIENPQLYRSVVGALLYASTSTRVDISTAVAQLCKYMHEPRQSHLVALKHLLRYLCGTVANGLRYSRAEASEMCGYADASYAQDPDSRKSVTGYAFLLAGASIVWMSRQQSVVATSTMEAELIAAASATDEAIFLRQLLDDVNVKHSQPTVLYCDNQPMIHMVNNNTTTQRSKHIDVRFRVVEERIASKLILIKYKPSEHLPADLLTKNLPGPGFITHFKALSGLLIKP
jgi:hypothetical protein